MPGTVSCLIGLGTNLGDRQANLDRVVALLRNTQGIDRLRLSAPQQTAPVGGPSGQSAYLNAAAYLETALSPHALLDRLQQLEQQLGRERGKRWGPRIIDLDVLLYGDTELATSRLTIPHPRMVFRRFVLEPAVEVAPDLVHPPTGWTIAQLLRHLDETPPYLALAGPACAQKTALAREIAQRSGGKVLSNAIPAQVDLQTAAEWLNARSTILTAARGQPRVDQLPVGDSQPFTVSDFWLDQSLIDIRHLLNPNEQEVVEAYLREAQKRVVPPRLTALVDLTASPDSAAAGESASGLPLLDELGQLARQSDRGPVFMLGRTTPAGALTELTAALAAW